jgi:hypothetical protein
MGGAVDSAKALPNQPLCQLTKILVNFRLIF